jgi:hypothetical protein
MDKNGPNRTDKDPALEATSLPRERVLAVVNGVALTALDELRQLREQCDGLIRSLTERQKTLAHDIEEFARLAQDTLAAKSVMSDALRQLTNQYVKSPVSETVAEMPKPLPSPPWPASGGGQENIANQSPRYNLSEVTKYAPKPRD